MKLRLKIFTAYTLLVTLYTYRWLAGLLYPLPWVDQFGDIWKTMGDATIDISAIRHWLKTTSG